MEALYQLSYSPENDRTIVPARCESDTLPDWMCEAF
jgi:hypothetical protein